MGKLVGLRLSNFPPLSVWVRKVYIMQASGEMNTRQIRMAKSLSQTRDQNQESLSALDLKLISLIYSFLAVSVDGRVRW